MDVERFRKYSLFMSHSYRLALLKVFTCLIQRNKATVDAAVGWTRFIVIHIYTQSIALHTVDRRPIP